jgi:hypothetical protein
LDGVDAVHLTDVPYLNVSENRGLDVEAPAAYPVAAGHEGGAAVDARLDIAQDLLELLTVDLIQREKFHQGYSLQGKTIVAGMHF